MRIDTVLLLAVIGLARVASALTVCTANEVSGVASGGTIHINAVPRKTGSQKNGKSARSLL